MRLVVTSKDFWLFLELGYSMCQQSFCQVFGIHCSLMIQVLKIVQNWMFPEKTFYNYNKLAFLVPLYEKLSSALNKSDNDGRLGLFQKKYFRLVKIKSIHEPSPLKQVLFFIKLIKSCLFKKVTISGSVDVKLKSPGITLL